MYSQSTSFRINHFRRINHLNLLESHFRINVFYRAADVVLQDFELRFETHQRRAFNLSFLLLMQCVKNYIDLKPTRDKHSIFRFSSSCSASKTTFYRQKKNIKYWRHWKKHLYCMSRSWISEIGISSNQSMQCGVICASTKLLKIQRLVL